MGQGIEVLIANRGQVLKIDASVDFRAVLLAAINGDVMAPCAQARGEFFRKGFESAVIRGNTARAEERDAHVPGRYLRVGLGRAGTAVNFFGAGLGYRLKVEPTGDVVIVGALALENDAAFREHSFIVLR